jgi:SAM-dependent methyltransferase
MPEKLKTSTYRDTRSAWVRIWDEEADLARELGTLEYARARQAQSLYLPHLPKDALILEAGCGMGIELVHLRRLGYRVAGIDYAAKALRPLQAYQPGHRLAVGDVHQLPYADGSFGAYLSFGVLEHADFGPGPALEEAWRVLGPGGVLIVTVPYPNLVWRLSRLKRRWSRPVSGERLSYFETAYTAHALEDFVRGAGFRLVSRHPIGHSFTLWGLGRPFRGRGYYETTPLAEGLGGLLRRVMPWRMCFESLIIARKAGPSE